MYKCGFISLSGNILESPKNKENEATRDFRENKMSFFPAKKKPTLFKCYIHHHT
jgi:hypothetical protein